MGLDEVSSSSELDISMISFIDELAKLELNLNFAFAIVDLREDANAFKRIISRDRCNLLLRTASGP